MAKVRVYEYAKELNMSSKEIIAILKRLNIPVKGHMSIVEEDAQMKINQFFQDIKRKANEEKMRKIAENKAPHGSKTQENIHVQKEEPASSHAENRAVQVENRPHPSGSDKEKNEISKRQQGQGKAGSVEGSAHQVASRPQGETKGRPEENRAAGENRPRQEGSRSYGENRPRQEGNRSYGENRPRQEGNRSYGENRPRQEGNRSYGESRPRQEGTRPFGDNRPRQEGNRFTKDGGNRPPKGEKNTFDKERRFGGKGVERKDRLSIPPAPQVEEKTEQPRRRVQKKKDFEPTDEVKKNLKKGGKLKVITPSIDFDDERGEVVRGKKRNKNKKNKDIIFGEDKETPTKIVIGDTINVGEFAKMIGKEPGEVIKKLLLLGVIATINQEIDFDVAGLVAAEYGIEVEKKVIINEDEFEMIEEHDDPESLVERPPVVTIMGHVDHGKTTLLDSIRHTRVTATEAGGITQHIGAYQVEINDKLITFLDTPGHEAFTAMRARGAKVTDITVLVVAADDGVMPQTVEAINHAKAANVPIIVAVNKIDKPNANPDRVKQELSEYGLIPEEWGGDTIFVPVSALKGEGIRELLEMILLVAEVQELKANPNKRARGTVIEAELDKGKGPVATVLVQSGTLRVGDSVVVGTAYGRIRSMTNDLGKRIKEALPSTPVSITGLDSVPEAGDQFMVFESDSKAKEIASHRALKKRELELKKNQVSLDDLFNQIKEGEVKDLNLIIKADVQGSVEALKSSIEKIHVEGVRVRVIHTGVGAINESDVTLASASNAIIIGFNVRPVANAKTMAEQEKVEIRLHSIIYKVIEEIENALKGMLDPVYEEKVIGQLEVRQIFRVSKIGTIAGCYVTEGKVTRDSGVRVIRDGIVIFEGKLDSLKRFKDDAREVAQGYECGLTIKNFNDIKEGDVLEAYIMETVKQ